MNKNILIIATSRADKYLLSPLTDGLGKECGFIDLSSWEPYEIQKMIWQYDILSEDDNWERIVLLGDRYETCLLAVHAVDTGKIIFHIHGGEITSGSKDEYFRHAITKLSKVHLTCHKNFADRIIRMGEAPENIFISGALGVWRAKRIKPEEKQSKTLTVILHPNTIEPDKTESEITTLLNALKSFSDNFRIKFYAPNHDSGRGIIERKIKAFIELFGGEYIEEEYGDDFLHSLKHSACIIGNSSCGIIESPSLKTPTINIGSRQDGRPRAASILQCDFNEKEIRLNIDAYLSLNWHGKDGIGYRFKNPYDNTEEDTVEMICDIIKNHPVNFQKRFKD
jgi:UDP-hydrolysing UDP-N-acetyl-D-glucosamine 2-epimerase